MTKAKQQKQPILQSLDIEDSCFGIYSRGEFYYKDFEKIIKAANLAWRHSHSFEDENFTYLSLLSKSRDLSEYSSDPSLLRATQSLMEAQKKAALTAKLDFSDMCFFDIIPDHLIGRWFALREESM